MGLQYYRGEDSGQAWGKSIRMHNNELELKFYLVSKFLGTFTSYTLPLVSVSSVVREVILFNKAVCRVSSRDAKILRVFTLSGPQSHFGDKLLEI